MKELAIEKLKKELSDVSGRYQDVIKKPVCDALISFCRQDAEFAQAVYQSGKTLAQCCAEIVKGNPAALSDLDAYNRAVKFYFPGAAVRMELEIDLCAEVRTDEAKPARTLHLSLDDFLL